MTPATNTTIQSIRDALDAGRTVRAIVHDDRGQRHDGEVTNVFGDGEVAFYGDDERDARYVRAIDVLELDLDA